MPPDLIRGCEAVFGRHHAPTYTSMMPKSAKRFSGDIMLQLIENDHVHDFGSNRSKIIVI
jgi:hypothetical protein